MSYNSSTASRIYLEKILWSSDKWKLILRVFFHMCSFICVVQIFWSIWNISHAVSDEYPIPPSLAVSKELERISSVQNIISSILTFIVSSYYTYSISVKSYHTGKDTLIKRVELCSDKFDAYCPHCRMVVQVNTKNRTLSPVVPMGKYKVHSFNDISGAMPMPRSSSNLGRNNKYARREPNAIQPIY